jgi:hypothetical protein
VHDNKLGPVLTDEARIQLEVERRTKEIELRHQQAQMNMMRDEVPGALPPRTVSPASAPVAPEPSAAKPAQPSGRLNVDRL